MADAGARRHHAEIVESLLTPFQEPVALAVALVFMFDIVLEGSRRAEFVDDNGMIDDEIDRHQRVDLLRVAAERAGGIAHRRQIDDGGNTGEILHQHARRRKRDLLAGFAAILAPLGGGTDVCGGYRAAILVAQQVFEQNLQRIGQLRNALQAVLFGGGQGIILVFPAIHGQALAAFEAVEGYRHLRVPFTNWRTRERPQNDFRPVARDRQIGGGAVGFHDRNCGGSRTGEGQLIIWNCDGQKMMRRKTEAESAVESHRRRAASRHGQSAGN